jgi:hypothetical protein
MTIEVTGVDLRVVAWIKEFPLGCWQRVRVDGKLSEEVRLTSSVPQGSVLCPLMFIAYVNGGTLSLIYCCAQMIV